ncbi:MAG: hypothetical protein ABSC26_06395, partial [Stellaceae bacterium]
MNGYRRAVGAVALAAALLASFFAGPAARADEPLHLRLGWAVIPGQLVAILYNKPDILKHYGKSYTTETIRF